VFGSGGQRRRGALPFEAAFTQASAFFRQAAALAGRHRTTLCLEAIPPQHGADFIVSTDEAARLVAAVNHPAFALHLDTATLTLAGEDPVTLARRHGAAIRHCHISEPDMQPIGSQGVDHERITAALQSAGYRHWLSVEMFATDAPESRLPPALAEVRRCYGALAGA